MQPSTARTLIITTCLLAGCGAPAVTSGPAPGTADVQMTPTDPETLAQLSGFSGQPNTPPNWYPSKPPSTYPSVAPTYAPTSAPTYPPTAQPTNAPTYPPTAEPTYPPTAEPTYPPTAEPTYPPTAEPTYPPTAEPTYAPTYPPTAQPTYPPTYPPTTPPKDCGCKVTGGGTTTTYGGAEVNFGFNAQHDKDGGAKGNLNVMLKGGQGNTHFKSDAVTRIDCNLDPGSQHPRLTGTVTVYGTLKGGGSFVWQVIDTGEPGVLDRVKFTVNGQVLFDNDLNANGAGPGGGNIQIHKEKCD